jgi:hypothetical protein
MTCDRPLSSCRQSTRIDLNTLIQTPDPYDFFTFRPHLKKLILSGAAETQHLSILWYTIPNGSVGQHHHTQTEAIYTIHGSQTDTNGVYPTGSLAFNPPGSAHAITHSSGFFLLAYASPPNFDPIAPAPTASPIQINTLAPDLDTQYPFTPVHEAVSVYPIPLDPAGGIRAELVNLTAAGQYTYRGNCLLVLQGRCTLDGTPAAHHHLVVAPTLEHQAYQVRGEGDRCLVLGLAFEFPA